MQCQYLSVFSHTCNNVPCESIKADLGIEAYAMSIFVFPHTCNNKISMCFRYITWVQRTVLYTP